FLREYELLGDFKLNLETNHATLAGHSMQHELEVAIAAEALGSIDANTGDLLLGWDTDQFPTSVYLTTEIMLSILKMGGLVSGEADFKELETYMLKKGDIEPNVSGRQEFLENLINEFI